MCHPNVEVFEKRIPEREYALRMQSTIAPAYEKAMSCKELNFSLREDWDKNYSIYYGKRITVTGTVIYAGPDIHKAPSIELSDAAGGDCYVLCCFPDEEVYKRVKVGDVITAQGNFLTAHQNYGICLKHCSLGKTKNILITGAASGLGKEVSTILANEGHHLLLADRNEKGLEELKAELSKVNPFIETEMLDLSSLASVDHLVETVKAKNLVLDGILCNAGISSAPGRTVDDLDLVFEINYLGHFALTLKLWDNLTEDGRTMLISSDMHAGLFAPLTYKPAMEVAKPDESFAQSPDRYNFSKLYLLYFCYTFTEKLKAAGSHRVINAFNPGLMHTTNLMPDKSQFTEEFLAMVTKINMMGNLEVNSKVVAQLMEDESLNKESGLYYDRSTTAIRSSDLSYVEEYQKELWDLSLQLTGIKEEDIKY